MGFYLQAELNEEQYNDMQQKIDENGYVKINGFRCRICETRMRRPLWSENAIVGFEVFEEIRIERADTTKDLEKKDLDMTLSV